MCGRGLCINLLVEIPCGPPAPPDIQIEKTGLARVSLDLRVVRENYTAINTPIMRERPNFEIGRGNCLEWDWESNLKVSSGVCFDQDAIQGTRREC